MPRDNNSSEENQNFPGQAQGLNFGEEKETLVSYVSRMLEELYATGREAGELSQLIKSLEGQKKKTFRGNRNVLEIKHRVVEIFSDLLIDIESRIFATENIEEYEKNTGYREENGAYIERYSSDIKTKLLETDSIEEFLNFIKKDTKEQGAYALIQFVAAAYTPGAAEEMEEGKESLIAIANNLIAKKSPVLQQKAETKSKSPKEKKFFRGSRKSASLSNSQEETTNNKKKKFSKRKKRKEFNEDSFGELQITRRDETTPSSSTLSVHLDLDQFIDESNILAQIIELCSRKKITSFDERQLKELLPNAIKHVINVFQNDRQFSLKEFQEYLEKKGINPYENANNQDQQKMVVNFITDLLATGDQRKLELRDLLNTEIDKTNFHSNKINLGSKLEHRKNRRIEKSGALRTLPNDDLDRINELLEKKNKDKAKLYDQFEKIFIQDLSKTKLEESVRNGIISKQEYSILNRKCTGEIRKLAKNIGLTETDFVRLELKLIESYLKSNKLELEHYRTYRMLYRTFDQECFARPKDSTEFKDILTQRKEYLLQNNASKLQKETERQFYHDLRVHSHSIKDSKNKKEVEKNRKAMVTFLYREYLKNQDWETNTTSSALIALECAKKLYLEKDNFLPNDLTHNPDKKLPKKIRNSHAKTISNNLKNQIEACSRKNSGVSISTRAALYEAANELRKKKVFVYGDELFGQKGRRSITTTMVSDKIASYSTEMFEAETNIARDLYQLSLEIDNYYGINRKDSKGFYQDIDLKNRNFGPKDTRTAIRQIAVDKNVLTVEHQTIKYSRSLLATALNSLDFEKLKNSKEKKQIKLIERSLELAKKNIPLELLTPSDLGSGEKKKVESDAEKHINKLFEGISENIRKGISEGRTKKQIFASLVESFYEQTNDRSFIRGSSNTSQEKLRKAPEPSTLETLSDSKTANEETKEEGFLKVTISSKKELPIEILLSSGNIAKLAQQFGKPNLSLDDIIIEERTDKNGHFHYDCLVAISNLAPGQGPNNLRDLYEKERSTSNDKSNSRERKFAGEHLKSSKSSELSSSI